MIAWQPAYIGVGSNLDDPKRQVERALDALGELAGSRLIARSSLYRTAPFGPVAQPEFVNAVAALLTQLSPQDLLDALRALETAMGRTPVVQRWGPRRIDLDLLIQGDARIDTPSLQLPHPGIVARNFVLYPLRELAPDLMVPGLGRVAELAARVDPNGIRPLQ